MHQLPLAADDPDIAWSRYTGTWRQIRIDYPTRFGYGGWPLGVFAGGLARALFWGSITFVLLPVVASVSWDLMRDELSRETTDTFAIEAAFVLVFVGIALIPLINLINGLIRLFLGGSDLISRPRTVEGIVVKLHEGKVAVDNGHAEEVRAWQPNPASPHLSLGSRIRATMSPHLAHVTSVEVIAAPGAAGGGSAIPD